MIRVLRILMPSWEMAYGRAREHSGSSSPQRSSDAATVSRAPGPTRSSGGERSGARHRACRGYRRLYAGSLSIAIGVSLRIRKARVDRERERRAKHLDGRAPPLPSAAADPMDTRRWRRAWLTAGEQGWFNPGMGARGAPG